MGLREGIACVLQAMHELAQRCGMKQSAFARLESGNANPTLETLKRVAEGLGKQLRISFV